MKYFTSAVFSLLFISEILLNVAPSFAVVYVDCDRAGGDGTTWAQAYSTLEAAISGNGINEEFWIAECEYTPASVLYTREGSSFYGGFAGNETQLSQRNIKNHPTIINGQGSIKHVFYVLTISPNVRFDGLTIKGGAATGSTASDEGTGGGILVNQVPVVIQDCVITGNTARGLGGGVSVFSSSNVLISGCTFSNNTVLEGGGGGLSLYWDPTTPNPPVSHPVIVEKSIFQGNEGAVDGGGLYSAYFPITVKESDFINNTADNGAGIKLDYKLGNGSPAYGVDTISRCSFVNNVARITGGGLQTYARTMIVENSVFASNSAPVGGGGIGLHSGSDAPANFNPYFTATFQNCSIYGNQTDGFGGGVVCTGHSNKSVGMMAVYLYNTILWNNSAVEGHYPGQPSNDISNTGSCSMTTRYSDMETLTWAHGSVPAESHTGSFAENPKFIDPDGVDNAVGTIDDNFHLLSTSPCVDRADGNFAPALDMDFMARVDLRKSNMGTGSPPYADLGPYEVLEGDQVINIAPTMMLLRDTP